MDSCYNATIFTIHFTLRKPIINQSLSNNIKCLRMNVSTVFSHFVQAYGFAQCRNLEVTDVFRMDPPPTDLNDPDDGWRVHLKHVGHF